jgi:aryl-alcohol dehydrogenase-like predicted oxidoreductase
VHYRILGKSGLLVSEIGFGAWGIGGATPGSTSYGQTDDKTSLNALSSALDLGINFFDTSNVYGYGRSEQLIGQAFSQRRSEVVIATKVGFLDYVNPPDFSAKAIRHSVSLSLKRLKTDYIDLLQLHNPSADWLEEHPDTLLALQQMLKEGVIRAVGVSVKTPMDAFSLLKLFPFQTVQANFNMLDIRVLECGLMDRLDLLGAGLIARTPLSFGFLSGSLTGEEEFALEDHRSRWPREQIRLWAKGARDLYACCLESSNTPQYQIALRFCLSFPQVSTTIVGMLTHKEVAANVLASVAGPLSLNSCNRIKAIHKTNKFLLG